MHSTHAESMVYISECEFKGFLDIDGDRSFLKQYNWTYKYRCFSKFGTTDGTITKNVVIEKCYFGCSDHPKMKAWNRAIGSHASRYNCYYENIHINQNIFDNLNEYALTPLKSKYTFITKINL